MKWPDDAQARQLKRFQLMQRQAQQIRLIVDDLETKERPKTTIGAVRGRMEMPDGKFIDLGEGERKGDEN